MWILVSILRFVVPVFAFLTIVRWVVRRNWKTIDRSNEIDIKGKTVVITGANSGIGKITAYELADRGAHVVLACRDVGKGNDAVTWIREKTLRGSLDCMALDLSSLHSIRQFCKDFEDKYNKIDILINNAGVYFPGNGEKTADGFEIHMGVNHLGHFLLTNLLLNLLKRGTPSRIIILTSLAHVYGKLDFDDFMSEKKSGFMHYIFQPAYANSKLANVLFSKELSKQLKGTGVNCYALCPGMVDTDLIRNFTGILWVIVKVTIILLKFIASKSVEVGAETTLYCALSKDVGDQSGEVYQHCGFWGEEARVPLKDEDAEKLWKVSKRLVGLK